jgi:hypothetical protein
VQIPGSKRDQLYVSGQALSLAVRVTLLTELAKIFVRHPQPVKDVSQTNLFARFCMSRKTMVANPACANKVWRILLIR